MELSITNSAVYGVRSGETLSFLPKLGIEQCARAGFTRMEYNFCAGPAKEKPLADDQWKARMEDLRQTLDVSGVKVPYTHSFWYILSKMENEEKIAANDEMIRRSVEASAMLGASVMVVHAQSVYGENGYDAVKTREYNRDFFARLGEEASRFGLTLAVENVFSIPGSFDFTVSAEDMAELMLELNDPMFGICWDLGHANMAGLDHEKALETVAPWLRHVHAGDNSGKIDAHTVPGYGTVPWERVMKKLKEIGYQGDLNLSVRIFAQTTMPEQRVDWLRSLYATGQALIGIFDRA